MKLPEISTLHGLFAQGKAQPDIVTLFKDWTRLTTDNHGEMHGQPLEGLFCAETLFVTHYDIHVNGKPVSHRFSAQLDANTWSSTGAILGSGDQGNLAEGTLPKGTIEVRILRKVDQGITETIYIKNNGEPSQQVRLSLALVCPITDTEYEEEMKIARINPRRGIRPKIRKPSNTSGSNEWVMRFERDFGPRRRTPVKELRRIYGDEGPRDGQRVTRALEIQVKASCQRSAPRLRACGGKISHIRMHVELGPREEAKLEIRYEPWIDGYRMPAPDLDGLSPLPREKPDLPEDSIRIYGSNSTFNLVVGQAMVDLESLRLPLFGRTILERPRDYDGFIAGIPRYLGVFGRDNVISGWQGILFNPQYLDTALSRVALYQGVAFDRWRDEEPNRMLHERRLDPYSETGELNRDLYYGDVTSTPFWILALASLYSWTGDPAIVRKHEEALVRCAEWVLARLKRDNGFIYYAPSPHNPSANRNQAWKDSGDAIVDEYGRIRVPPLALIEIQAYAYQSLIEAARLLPVIKPGYDGRRLKEAAAQLKERFNQKFWVEDPGFYSYALDWEGHPLKTRASNMGHCLGTGILASDRAQAVTECLMSEEMFSGWGIRTLSCYNPGYDPVSYHRGSVWPVENAIIADGMSLEGFHEEANRIITAQLTLASLFQHMRLPEVFSGHPRATQSPVPGLYTFANLLQTWSVTAIFQFVQTIIGLRPRADQGVIYLNPKLPEWLQWIELKNLSIAGKKVHLRVWRDEQGQNHFSVLNPVHGLRFEYRPARSGDTTTSAA